MDCGSVYESPKGWAAGCSTHEWVQEFEKQSSAKAALTRHHKEASEYEEKKAKWNKGVEGWTTS